MRYLLDLDDTLIVSYMNRPDKDFHAIELLAGVLETWKRLRWETGNNLAVVTNQGGVAFGYNTETDVIEKFKRVGRALGYCWIEVRDGSDVPFEAQWTGGKGSEGVEGVLTFFVCYADARSQEPRYNDPAQVARRKPSGAMIREAMEGERGEAIYIGDRPEDQAAAQDAGVNFQWAQDFFTVV